MFDNALRHRRAAPRRRMSLIGFDVTEFLDHAALRSPVTLYLFHLVRQLLDGRRFVCWMDEFWRLLADPAFEGFAKDAPKTWRKLNGVMCLATQSASDVLESPISRTLVEQTPTKVFFPNADANLEYTQGLGLTRARIQAREAPIGARFAQFLVKQAHHSVVCELALKGFAAELAVISGRISEVERMHRSCRRRGADPARGCPISCCRPDPHVLIESDTSIGDDHADSVGFLHGLPCWSFAVRRRRTAQWAVIDAPAIAQLVQEVQTMQQQLTVARKQLQPAQQSLQSMSGGRGMERLCRARHAIICRPTGRRLPRYGPRESDTPLSAEVQRCVAANAVLSPNGWRRFLRLTNSDSGGPSVESRCNRRCARHSRMRAAGSRRFRD